MCRNVLPAGRKIPALTASPVNGAAMKDAVSAREGSPQSGRSGKIAGPPNNTLRHY